ncbi:hypothetical protein NW762_013401 [Fusarium torreyae]|uniref:Uncharacterized protein n=1 Tax=Fusarium torreyae TaxID=1237075 RepID=A0A9W8VAD9_9HYPO|nr:hypothetical protein NW762_013401 [Fusarium torreyae]
MSGQRNAAPSESSFGDESIVSVVGDSTNDKWDALSEHTRNKIKEWDYKRNNEAAGQATPRPLSHPSQPPQGPLSQASPQAGPSGAPKDLDGFSVASLKTNASKMPRAPLERTLEDIAAQVKASPVIRAKCMKTLRKNGWIAEAKSKGKGVNRNEGIGSSEAVMVLQKQLQNALEQRNIHSMKCMQWDYDVPRISSRIQAGLALQSLEAGNKHGEVASVGKDNDTDDKDDWEGKRTV